MTTITAQGREALNQPMSETRYIAEHNTVLRAVVGSRSHGTNVDDQDDRDEMGVFVEPPEYVVGTRRGIETYTWRTQGEGVRSGPGDLDLTLHSMQKFCHLAAKKGNPTVLGLLFVPDAGCTVRDHAGIALRDNADMFASKRAVRAFYHYMKAQKERLLGERGQMRVNRPELIERYGYDVKYAAHALRLGVQGLEYAQSGRFTLPMPEPQRSEILSVRRGERTLEQVRTRYEWLETMLEEALNTSPLPLDPDWNRIDTFLIDTYRRHWEMRFAIRWRGKP